MDSVEKTADTSKIDYLSFGYGGIVFSGGLMGYIKASKILSILFFKV